MSDRRSSVIVDPWPRRMDEISSRDAAQRLAAGLWKIGGMVLDDLEAILRGLPSRSLHGEPALLGRCATPDTAPAPVDAR